MNIAASITLKKQLLPAAVVPSGNLRCRLKKSDGAVAAETSTFIGAPNVTFSAVADGTYTVEAVRMSMANEPMGDSAESDPIDVVNLQEVDVPATISVSLT